MLNVVEEGLAVGRLDGPGPGAEVITGAAEVNAAEVRRTIATTSSVEPSHRWACRVTGRGG